VHGVRITGNILVGDNGKLLSCVNVKVDACKLKPITIDHSSVPAIIIHADRVGAASSDVFISNNIVTSVQVAPNTLDARVTNNLCVLTNGKCTFGAPLAGGMLWAGKPGNYAGHNVIADFDAKALFRAYDTQTMTYDFSLRRANPAAGK
jgi:hypothetical protein